MFQGDEEAMTIWKYKIEITDEQEIAVPEYFHPLTCQIQNGEPYIWAIVDNLKPLKYIKIYVYGTGNPIPEHLGNYLDTFQIYDGKLVFHVFWEER